MLNGISDRNRSFITAKTLSNVAQPPLKATAEGACTPPALYEDYGAMPRFFCTVLLAGTLVWLTGCTTSPETSRKVQTRALAKSHFARLGTNKVHYLTAGKGDRTIVFVHCWAGNSGFWREQLPALADKARLILVDLPGHGQSDKPRGDYSMDFFASAVLAVMRDARVDRATLIGHSMGVAVICRVHAQAPGKVAALVAVDGLLRRPKRCQSRHL